MAAETKQKSSGQYTTSLKCGDCGATSYGNNYHIKRMMGWICAHCGKKH